MKILYVEDNPGDAGLFQHEFAETAPSVKIDWVETYMKAVERLSMGTPEDTSYDLVLTDMNLPDGTGISLLSFIREKELRMPVVVMTGIGDEESAIKVLKAGASDYIIKRDDYLARLPSVLDTALRRFRIETARRSEPLNVLYCEYNLQDIESIQRHISVHAPYIRLDVVNAYQEVLDRFSLVKKITGNSLNPCDLVLLNYRVTGITSIELIKQLREAHHSDVPIVIMSYEENQDIALQALRFGADDFILKNPGYLYQLPSVLENAFNRVQVERERAALKASEYHFRLLIENVSDLILVLDKDGIIRHCSPSLEKIIGFKPEEIIGKRFDESIHPDDIPVLLADFSRLIKTPGITSGPQALRIITGDGSWRYMEAIAKSTLTASGQGIVIINSRDITERKKAEEALQKSEDRFRSLVEKSTEAITLIDSSGKILYASPPIKSLLGYSEEEFIMLEQDELIHPDDVSIHENALANLSANPQKTVVYSLRLRHKDGTWRWIENALHDLREDPSVRAIIANVRDITPRKEAEAALQESEIKYRSLVENSLVGVGIFQDDRLIFVNNKFCEIFGFTYEEITKQDLSDFIHPDDRAIMKDNAKRIFEYGDTVECHYRILRKDNKVINVKTFSTSVIYQGRPAAIGIIIDITREMLLENQLRQSLKMEAIGTLAGGIAHDFNNILTVLTGYSTLLKLEMEKGIPLKATYLDAIMSASLKASNLTQSLLAFSRQQPVSLRPVKLNEIVSGTEKMLRRLLTEDIALKTGLSPDDMIVMADTTQIDQVLINLVVNARDAMPRGGAITIETRKVYIDKESAEIRGLADPGQYALLSIIDTGTGMNDATKEHLFEPFFTTKDVGKGTGLGLSTIYGIIKQHNGHISVYSEEMIGTSFHIYLPITDTTLTEKKAYDMPKGGSETILLAEDNEEVREFMTTVLRKSGYSVIEAVDGEAAIERFKANKGISLLILDSVMPKKNGRQVYDEISAKYPRIKIIFTSGYTRDVILDKGIEDKTFEFISKPVSPETLLRKVRESLDR